LKKIKNREIDYLILREKTINDNFEPGSYDYFKKEQFSVKSVDIVPPVNTKTDIVHIRENRIYL